MDAEREEALGLGPTLPPFEELAYQLLRLARGPGRGAVVFAAYRDDLGFGYGSAVELWDEGHLVEVILVPSRVVAKVGAALEGTAVLGELDLEVDHGHAEDEEEVVLRLSSPSEVAVDAAWREAIVARVEALARRLADEAPADVSDHPAAVGLEAAVDAAIASRRGVELDLGVAEAFPVPVHGEDRQRMRLHHVRDDDLRALVQAKSGLDLEAVGTLAEGTFRHRRAGPGGGQVHLVRVTYRDDRWTYGRWADEGYASLQLRCQPVPVAAPPPRSAAIDELLDRVLAGVEGGLAVYGDALAEAGDARGASLVDGAVGAPLGWLGHAAPLVGSGAVAVDGRGAVELVASPTTRLDTEAWAALAAEPHWRAVTSLWLTRRCPPALVAYLLRHAPLHNLRVLVAAAPPLGRLEASACADSLEVIAGGAASSAAVGRAVARGAFPRLRCCAVFAAPFGGRAVSPWGRVGHGSRTVPAVRLHRADHEPSLHLLREVAALGSRPRA